MSDRTPSEELFSATDALLRDVGHDDQDHMLEGLQDCIERSLALLQSARRLVQIYSHDLDKPLYDHSDIVNALSQFARGSRRSEVQILVIDPKPVVQRGHGLLELKHRLPSHIHIKQVNPDYPIEEVAYLIVDDEAMLVRNNPQYFSGFVNDNSPRRAHFLGQSFSRHWERAKESVELRRMSL